MTRSLMPYPQGIRLGARGVIPLATGAFVWDLNAPVDNYIEANFPALNRSDKAMLAQVLGTLAPRTAATYGMRFPQDGNDSVYQSINAQMLSSGAWQFDDPTIGALQVRSNPNTLTTYWASSPHGTFAWQIQMELSNQEFSVGAPSGGAIHLICDLGGSFAQNASIRTGSWAPDLPTVDVFHLWANATTHQFIFQYAVAPVPTPIAWTNLATLDATNGLTILNGMTVVVARNPINPMEVATKQYVDSQIAAGAGGGLPPGGATGTLLTKTSPTNFAADWEMADGGTY